jgi:hypothetical protein
MNNNNNFMKYSILIQFVTIYNVTFFNETNVVV